jgi:hypothetical protein
MQKKFFERNIEREKLILNLDWYIRAYTPFNKTKVNDYLSPLKQFSHLND